MTSRAVSPMANRGVSPACSHPRYGGLRSAVDRLISAGVSLAEPVEIREWTGDARRGRFVQIDHATYALHVGRGQYLTVDLQRDLNGETPAEAMEFILCRSGAVRRPDARRSFNFYH